MKKYSQNQNTRQGKKPTPHNDRTGGTDNYGKDRSHSSTKKGEKELPNKMGTYKHDE